MDLVLSKYPVITVVVHSILFRLDVTISGSFSGLVASSALGPDASVRPRASGSAMACG